MTRSRHVRRSEQRGCLVYGVCARSDGRPLVNALVRFMPSRGGIWDGSIVGRGPIDVRTTVRGSFEVRLAPSSVVGRYEVILDEVRYAVEVPDQPEAAFKDILALS